MRKTVSIILSLLVISGVAHAGKVVLADKDQNVPILTETNKIPVEIHVNPSAACPLDSMLPPADGVVQFAGCMASDLSQEGFTATFDIVSDKGIEFDIVRATSPELPSLEVLEFDTDIESVTLDSGGSVGDAMVKLGQAYSPNAPGQLAVGGGSVSVWVNDDVDLAVPTAVVATTAQQTMNQLLLALGVALQAEYNVSFAPGAGGAAGTLTIHDEVGTFDAIQRLRVLVDDDGIKNGHIKLTLRQPLF